MRVSRVLKGAEISATTAHEDYMGWDPITLMRSHLPRKVALGIRLSGDYETGQKEFIRELEELGI